jgi:hypothetical protein
MPRDRELSRFLMAWSAHNAHRIHEEAAMAATIVNTTSQNPQLLRYRVLCGLRATINAFVSSRMQHAISESVCAKRLPHSRVENFAARTSHRTEAPKSEWQPLGEDILSAAISTFFIGHNKAGLWIAREGRGRIGGIFLLKSSAIAFARAKSETEPCALVLPSGKFELDLENHGNPLARHAESLLHVAARLGRRMAFTTGTRSIGAACRHAALKRFGAWVLMVGLVVSALAVIVALKAAISIYGLMGRLLWSAVVANLQRCRRIRRKLANDHFFSAVRWTRFGF